MPTLKNSKLNRQNHDLMVESGIDPDTGTPFGDLGANPAVFRQHVQTEALAASTGQSGLDQGDAAKRLIERFDGSLTN